MSLPAWWQRRKGSVAHAVAAGRRCLAASRHRPADVGVLVSAGVYRDGHVAEPAIAAYIQHRLGINVEFQGRPTLSFDLLNGGCGMLNAAQVVGAMLQSGQAAAGMVVAGEANSDRRPDPASAVARSGAALLLDLSPCGDAGFGAFAFRTHEEDAELFSAVVSLAEPRGRLLDPAAGRGSRRPGSLTRAGAVDEVLAPGGADARPDRPRRPGPDLGGVPRRACRRRSASRRTGWSISPRACRTPARPRSSSPGTGCAPSVRQPPATRVLFLAFGSGLTVGAAIYTV